MLVDKDIPAKLAKAVQYYWEQCFEKVGEVSDVEMWETREHFRSEPGDSEGASYKAAKPGAKWGGSFVTCWFRADVKLPEACDGQPVFLRARTGGDEALFVVDGEHRGNFDGPHPIRMMTIRGKAGKTCHVALEAYSGHNRPDCGPHDRDVVVAPKSRSFDGIDILVERKDVTAFTFDLSVLVELEKHLDENSLRRARIQKGLEQVFSIIDAMPQESGEESWRPRLAEARRVMKPLLAAKNGDTAPVFGLWGNSHLDTAWLWPIGETWRKAARTFSSVLNLMERYDEWGFIQSAPCHADVMRKEYPDIFERMQKMAAAGRWEPNGGMWVEPDANIPSGEAFVRQFLVGQRATREMFGFTSDTLWLPDVFGYSAALPQIMTGCDVKYFCTQKISWNDTTRFPFDTFVWEGIDGTRVITHYISGYCSQPGPRDVINHWNNIQHKDVQDRLLLVFGFGDGGGGPTMQMLESAQRIRDLEGMPRTAHMSASAFMNQLDDEIGTELPLYVGELYLEGHRGTLTSIAKIKRGNRKTELALRDVEWLSTLAALHSGTKYPAAEILDIWKTLLTNQFHDILPGSSIAEVNDEAIGEFERLGNALAEMANQAMRDVAGDAPDDNHLLVFNSLGWRRSDELALAGAPVKTRPADPAIQAQWIADVAGEKRLLVGGLEVPALGAAVLELEAGEPATDASPFKVSDRGVETPFARVRFDKAGRISSFIEKSTGRNIVRANGRLNTFLVGEDIPGYWDNWNLDRDHRLKLTADDRLVSREVVADGPLQVRLRSVYDIGAGSRLTQDMVFHACTPRVDFDTILDWNEKHKLLKVAFELDVLADAARHEIQYGHATRPTHENLPQDRARFEVCAHKWTDLSESRFGVAILNDCKYGVGVLGNEVRLSLMRSGTHPDARGDAGTHCFTYALLPHAEGFSVGSVVRPAYELNVAPLCTRAGADAEGFGGLVTADAPNVVIESVKWAEEENGFVVRLYEAEKTGTNVTLSFDEVVQSVAETNMLEEEPKDLRLRKSDNALPLYLRPFEIKTLLCRTGD